MHSFIDRFVQPHLKMGIVIRMELRFYYILLSSKSQYNSVKNYVFCAFLLFRVFSLNIHPFSAGRHYILLYRLDLQKIKYVNFFLRQQRAVTTADVTAQNSHFNYKLSARSFDVSSINEASSSESSGLCATSASI